MLIASIVLAVCVGLSAWKLEISTEQNNLFEIGHHDAQHAARFQHAKALGKERQGALARHVLQKMGMVNGVERSVRWHLANPPDDGDSDFSADDRALSPGSI